MRITTILLNGDPIVVDVPDAQRLSAPVRTSVLSSSGVEVEVNAGTPEAADFFVSSTGSTLTSSLNLRSGQPVRVGSLGGGTGTVFVLDADPETVFGPVPPGVGLEELAALLSAAQPTVAPTGVYLTPGDGVAWSPYRTHDLVVSVETRERQQYLLDVRAAFTLGGDPQRSVGAPVTGGLLSRGGDQENRHVVLEAPGHVAYGIPLPQTDLDALTTSMSQIQVSAG